MLEHLPEPAVERVLYHTLGSALAAGSVLGASGCCHFKLARLSCRYVRGVSYYVDVPLRVDASSVRSARSVFARSTSVSVTGVEVDCVDEVYAVGALAVDPASLLGMRHVRLEMGLAGLAGLAGHEHSGHNAPRGARRPIGMWGSSGLGGLEIVVPGLDAERLVVGAAHALTGGVVLSRSPNLRDLELRSMTLDARGVERIARACEPTVLRTLRVSLSRVTLGALGALGAMRLTALDVSGIRTIPKLEIPTLERLRARFTAMQPGSLSALTSLTFLDVRGALVVDYAGARSHGLQYLDIGGSGLPWPDRWCDVMPVEVCLCDGAHWRVGPCAAARYELASSHIALVTTMCLDRSLERAL